MDFWTEIFNRHFWGLEEWEKPLAAFFLIKMCFLKGLCLCLVQLFLDVLSQMWHCLSHSWIKSSRVFAMCFILEPFYHMLDSENSILWSDLHMPSHHSKTYEDPIKEWYYHCPTCDKKFKNRSTSQKHAKIWSKNDISNVTFVTKHQRKVASHKDVWKCNPRMILTLCNKW